MTLACLALRFKNVSLFSLKSMEEISSVSIVIIVREVSLSWFKLVRSLFFTLARAENDRFLHNLWCDWNGKKKCLFSLSLFFSFFSHSFFLFMGPFDSRGPWAIPHLALWLIWPCHWLCYSMPEYLRKTEVFFYITLFCHFLLSVCLSNKKCLLSFLLWRYCPLYVVLSMIFIWW